MSTISLVNQQKSVALEQVQTTHLSKKGRGITTDKKIEVIGALPGEELLVLPFGKIKRKKLASIQKIISPSPFRVTPRCLHAFDCGGCSIQHMEYQAQLVKKEADIKELFAPLMGRYGTNIFSIIGSEDPWHYRNKMEFSFSQNRAGDKFLGLMRAGSKGHVLNLKECHLGPAWFIQAKEAVFTFFSQDTNLHAYSYHTDKGHLRTLTLRAAINGVGKMAILTVSGNPEYPITRKQLDAFVSLLQQTASQEELSIFLRIQQIGKGRQTQFFEMHLAGPDHITERMNVSFEDHRYAMVFKISPSSFFQPNTKQAEKLYSKAFSLVSSLQGKKVFDLYCGGATLGLIAAKVAQEVIGIEVHPYSIFDAEWNIEANQASNVSIYKGDVKEVLKELLPRLGSPDLLIMDPPRAGIDLTVLMQVHQLQPKEILYISCHPETQVRDLALFLEKGGYSLAAIAPVDQFPHTNHVENICFLKKI